MVFYVWVEVRLFDHEGQTNIGRGIVACKGGWVSLEDTYLLAMKVVADELRKRDLPVGAGEVIKVWTTLILPSEKKAKLYWNPPHALGNRFELEWEVTNGK